MVLGYNEPFAHPVSSFNEPVLPPTSEPDEGEQIQVCFSLEWLPYVLGALSQLQLQSTWKTDDPDIVYLTQGRATNLLGQFVNPTCEVEMVDAPYWDDDDAADADDEAPVDDQPWYGQIVTDGFTWQEQLSVWLVTAFVAYAATPAAAIAFLPVANQFVLEFKTGNLGGIVKIFANASEIGQVDTYSATAGVIEKPVVLIGAGGMGSMDLLPTLWVMLSDEANPAVEGTPSISVIRKRLTPDEISPKNIRYNPDSNTVQQTYDGGETWVDQPAADPRHATGFRRPARTDDDARCNAAQGMSDYIRHTLANWIASATLAQAATGILEILLLLAGGAGVLIDLIILALETLATIGEATIEAAFTDAVYDDLTCAFYCNIDNDGQMSAAQLSAFLAQVSSEHSGTVYNVVSVIANMTGEVLFSNAGVEGTETGDCSACICCDGSFGGDGEDGWEPTNNAYWCSTTYSAIEDAMIGAQHCAVPSHFQCSFDKDMDLTVSSITIRFRSDAVGLNHGAFTIYYYGSTTPIYDDNSNSYWSIESDATKVFLFSSGLTLSGHIVFVMDCSDPGGTPLSGVLDCLHVEICPL